MESSSTVANREEEGHVPLLREKEDEVRENVLQIIQRIVNPDEWNADSEKEWIKTISKQTIDYCKEALGKYRFIVNTTLAKKNSGFSSYSISLFDTSVDGCTRVIYDSEATGFQCIIYIYAISLN